MSGQRKSNAHLDNPDNSIEVIENEETHNVYKENFWPVKKVKNPLKKGVMKQLGKTEFKILDNKKIGGATQIEINVSDNEGRGSAIVDFCGPNKKKECTVLIKKSKDPERFVKIIAKKIIQPFLMASSLGKRTNLS